MSGLCIKETELQQALATLKNEIVSKIPPPPNQQQPSEVQSIATLMGMGRNLGFGNSGIYPTVKLRGNTSSTAPIEKRCRVYFGDHLGRVPASYPEGRYDKVSNTTEYMLYQSAPYGKINAYIGNDSFTHAGNLGTESDPHPSVAHLYYIVTIPAN